MAAGTAAELCLAVAQVEVTIHIGALHPNAAEFVAITCVFVSFTGGGDLVGALLLGLFLGTGSGFGSLPRGGLAGSFGGGFTLGSRLGSAGSSFAFGLQPGALGVGRDYQQDGCGHRDDQRQPAEQQTAFQAGLLCFAHGRSPSPIQVRLAR